MSDTDRLCAREPPRPQGRTVSFDGKGHPLPLMQIVITLIVVGVLLWLVNNFIPMQGSIKSILNCVVVIVVALWICNLFGVLHAFSRYRVGH